MDRLARAGAQRLAAIVESTDDAILAKDLAGTITEWNASAERLYGYAARDAIGRPVAMLVPPERKREDADILRRVLDGRRVDHFETERLRRDGSRVPVSLTVSAIRDASGSITGASSIARDDTERLQARADRSRLAALVAHSGSAILAVDADLRITECNPAAAELYRLPPEDVVGRVATELLGAPDDDERLALVRSLAGETVETEGVRTRLDGTEFAFAATLAPIRSASGAVVGAVSTFRDVTPQWQARLKLERDERHASILAHASVALDLSLEAPHVIAAITEVVVPELADLCVVLTSEGPGLPAEDVLLDPATPQGIEPWAARFPELRDALTMLTGSSVTLVALRHGGCPFGLMVTARLRPDAHFGPDDLSLMRRLADRVAQALVNARLLARADLARVDAEACSREMRAAQERFSSAFANAPVGMALVSVLAGGATRIDETNPAFSELTGLAGEDLRGRDLIDSLVHPADRDGAHEEVTSLLAGDMSVARSERRFVRSDGIDAWVHSSVARLTDSSRDQQLVVQVQDITERMHYERQLRHLSDHDPLTGLFNRRRFVEELDRAAATAYRHGVPTAVLVVNIDHFKYVNDTYGHAVGDEVISAVARTLIGLTRTTDVVGRLGGDEFGIVLGHSDVAAARTVVAALLDELHRPGGGIVVDGQPVAVNVSIGVKSLERQHGLTADELIVEADIAMYQAKDGGRDRMAVAGKDSVEPTRLRRRHAMSDAVKRALRHDDGFVFYEQPICSLATHDIERTEILLRMPDEHGEVLPPASFLHVADQFGLMPALDKWVIGRAIELLATRQAAGVTLGMEVNLSGTSIGDPGVIDFIAASVRNSGIDPTALTFEVTETEAIINVERARELSRQLSMLGCQFALDDFGAGFGSFYYLKHLPFDVVKIDGDFIKALPTSRTDQLTVEAIVTITRGMDKQTVAEFVGDQRTTDMLRSYGVDFVQGFHVGMPEPATPWPAYATAPVA